MKNISEHQNNNFRQEKLDKIYAKFEEFTLSFLVALNKRSNYDYLVEIRNSLYASEIKLETTHTMLKNHFDRQIKIIEAYSSNPIIESVTVRDILCQKYEVLDKPIRLRIYAVWSENRSKFEYKINCVEDLIELMVLIRLYPEKAFLEEQARELIRSESEFKILWIELEKILFQENNRCREFKNERIDTIICTDFIQTTKPADFIQNYNREINQIFKEISKL